MELESKKTFSENLIPFKTAYSKFGFLTWAPGIAAFLLIAFISIKVPDYFSSDVVIFIQPQKVNVKMLDTAEKTEQEEQFEALIQEMLSRPRLVSILEKFNLYPEYKGIKGKEKALIKMKNSITIEPITSPSGKVLTQTFRVSYSHNDANLAYKVADALSQLFINESTLTQMSKTRGTEEFLEANLREQLNKLAQIEEKQQEFTRKHSDQLPSFRQEAVVRLSSAQNQLATNSQLIQANLSRISYLQNELKLVRQSTAEIAAIGSQDSAIDPRVATAQLEQAVKVLTSRYSEKHPDVVAAKKRIEVLKSQSGGSTRGGVAVSENLVKAAPESRMVARELNELEVQTTALKSENEKLKELVENLNTNIKAMPIREQELGEILRDYTNVKESYQRLLEARENASLQSSLVKSQKGAQFKIVDPPSVPLVPAGPVRWVIAAAGFIFGLATMFGTPILLYFLNGSFKSRDEVEDELGVPVAGIIPTLQTEFLLKQKKKSRRISVAASVCSFFVAVIIVLLVV